MRRARKRLGLTQVEFAEKANLSQPVISHLERGGAVGKTAAGKVLGVLKAAGKTGEPAAEGELVSLEWLLGINRKVTVSR